MDLAVVGEFDSRAGFDEGWWNRRGRSNLDNALFLAVHVGAEEIARIELNQEFGPNSYVGVPRLGLSPLEIHLIEVRGDLRCTGIGTKIVGALTSNYPNRRLVAFSEGADGFWASLGWSRHLHRRDREPNPRYRPLYVQP